MPSLTCKEIIRNLYKIVEQGSGSDKLCSTIQAHLEDCSSCTKQYEELNDLILLCRKFSDLPIPDEQKKKMKEDLKKALSR